MEGYQIPNLWPFVMNGPLWLTQVLLVIYGNRITWTQRLVPGFGFMAVTMLVLPFLCHIGGSTGFWTSNVLLVFYGVSCGAAQGSTFMMGALFPFKYMSAIMLGNGISGFGSNVLRAGTLWIWPADKKPEN